jgi:hypothetical protein
MALRVAAGPNVLPSPSPDSHPSALQQDLAVVNGFTLAKGHPGSVWVYVRANRRLELFIQAQQPLASWRIDKVAASDGSAITAERVSLEGGPTTQPAGFTTHELQTTGPVTPGTYRIDLMGDTRGLYMRIDEMPTP